MEAETTKMTAHDPTERPVRSLQRPEKVFEVVARDIVREIQSKHLEPGSMLAPEAQMLVEYNVGRGSLREALRVLEVHGLIAMKPGPKGGPVVGEVTSSSFGRMASLYFQAGAMTFNELMEARTTLEPTLARLAAERRDPEGLRLLMEAAAPPARSHWPTTATTCRRATAFTAWSSSCPATA